MKYDVIIVGAGAAGLSMADRLLTYNKKINVLLLEKEAVPGRKLSASGNGKCNLTNEDYGINHYHGNNKKQLKHLISTYSKDAVIDFMEHLGILLYERNGYYYPLSNQAKQVTDVLVQNIKDKGAALLCRTRVIDIRQKSMESKDSQRESVFNLSAKLPDGTLKEFTSDILVLATGGMAAMALGGCDDGYQFADALGIGRSRIYPALAPIYVEDSFLPAAKGVRIDGAVTLKNAEGGLLKEKGQIQFNADCLSGICIMNLSAEVWKLSKERLRDALFIDVLPAFSWKELKAYFLDRQKKVSNQSLQVLLNCMFPERFGTYIINRLLLDANMPVRDLSEKHINRLTSNIKKLTFTPCMKKDFGKSQVTGGGVLLDEISLQSLESLRYPKLYIVGELLDVYGDCGGYNLTFAVCSGLQAADDIIRKWKND